MDGGKTTFEALRTKLTESPDGILERIATECGVSVAAVVRALPDEHRTIVSGARFLDLMAELETWGEVLVIVHTSDIVLECKGPIPPGTVGRGYYNLHGDSPVGGHIRYENCSEIAFVDRPFMGRKSCSVQFFNGAGEAMFKVFVRRDASRNLVPEQLERFEAARRRFGEAPEPQAPDKPTQHSPAPIPIHADPARAIPIIGARDLGMAKAFYADQLGFHETLYEDDGYLILRRGALEIHFWPTDDKDYLEKTAIYVRGGEIAALHAEFAARNVKGLSRLETKPWGMREFHIIDPSGNLLRFGMAPEEAA